MKHRRRYSSQPFVATGAYPVRVGNSIRPWVDGQPAFRRICEAVESAASRVWVTVAFLDRDVPMPDGSLPPPCQGSPLDQRGNLTLLDMNTDGSLELKCKRNRLGWKWNYPVAGLPIEGVAWREIVRKLRDQLPADVHPT